MIVTTSVLELGIDIGDLDHVLAIRATQRAGVPGRAVASL